MDFTGCPEPSCNAPAEIVDRYALLAAGSEPVVMQATYCVNDHRLIQPLN